MWNINRIGARADVAKAVESDTTLPDSVKARIREKLTAMPADALDRIEVSGAGSEFNESDKIQTSFDTLSIRVFKLLLPLLLILALMGPMKAHAQTAGIYTNIVNYLTGNDTNLTWIGNKLEIETGGRFQNNVQWANDLRVGYNLNDSWQLGVQIDNAGIAGTVEDYSGGPAFTLINSYAIKVEAGIDAGYSHLYEKAVLTPRAIFKKKMTANSYTFFGVSEPCYVTGQKNVPNPWVPSIEMGVGGTF